MVSSAEYPPGGPAGRAAGLETVDGTNWAGFVASPLAVLLVGKTTCPYCVQWAAELESFLATNHPYREVRFGKLLLDAPGLSSFKKASPWLASVDVLPYTVIYRSGQPKLSFAGGGLDRLVSRLQRITGGRPG
jgi:hypothetical protein